MKCNGFDSDNYRYFNLNKSGGYIPGIRPGNETKTY